VPADQRISQDCAQTQHSGAEKIRKDLVADDKRAVFIRAKQLQRAPQSPGERLKRLVHELDVQWRCNALDPSADVVGNNDDVKAAPDGGIDPCAVAVIGMRKPVTDEGVVKVHDQSADAGVLELVK